MIAKQLESSRTRVSRWLVVAIAMGALSNFGCSANGQLEAGSTSDASLSGKASASQSESTFALPVPLNDNPEVVSCANVDMFNAQVDAVKELVQDCAFSTYQVKQNGDFVRDLVGESFGGFPRGGNYDYSYEPATLNYADPNNLFHNVNIQGMCVDSSGQKALSVEEAYPLNWSNANYWDTKFISKYHFSKSNLRCFTAERSQDGYHRLTRDGLQIYNEIPTEYIRENNVLVKVVTHRIFGNKEWILDSTTNYSSCQKKPKNLGLSMSMTARHSPSGAYPDSISTGVRFWHSNPNDTSEIATGVDLRMSSSCQNY